MIVPTPVSVTSISLLPVVSARLAVKVSSISKILSSLVATVTVFVSATPPIKVKFCVVAVKSPADVVTSTKLTATVTSPSTSPVSSKVNATPTPSTAVASVIVTDALSLSVISPIASSSKILINCPFASLKVIVPVKVSVGSKIASPKMFTGISTLVLPAGMVISTLDSVM